MERGLTLPKGRSHVDALLSRILEDAELKLSRSFRVLLAQLKLERLRTSVGRDRITEPTDRRIRPADRTNR